MKNILLIVVCILLIIISLYTGSKVGEFNGADMQAKEKISEINSQYKPWFKNIWTPPSSEIESMLFSLQAAVGAGFIGYYIGRKQNVQSHNSTSKKQ